MKVELEFPIMMQGPDGKEMEVSVLHFPERLKAKHLKCMPKAFINGGKEVAGDEMVPMMAGLLEIPEEVAEQIDFKDSLNIAGMIPDFLEHLLQDDNSTK